MNFGLQRILIPIINGDIDRAAPLSDEDWDNKTFDAYGRYVSRVIFAAGDPRCRNAQSLDKITFFNSG